MIIMVSLNQLKKEYNSSLTEIPDERLKELFHQLYYQAYHAVFIDKDKELEEKALNTIDTLQTNNESWKVFRAAYNAIVWVPLQILMELHNKKNLEIKDIQIRWFFTWFMLLADDLEFNNSLIECIDNCKQGNERKCLNSIRKSLIKLRDTEMTLLKKDHNSGMPCDIIKHLESKKELSESETIALERIKEVDINGEFAET